MEEVVAARSTGCHSTCSTLVVAPVESVRQTTERSGKSERYPTVHHLASNAPGEPSSPSIG